MTSKPTFVRSDPSKLVIALLENELNYRAETHFMKGEIQVHFFPTSSKLLKIDIFLTLDEKKFLEEKIRCTACNKHMKNVFSKGEVSFHPSFEVIICKVSRVN